MPDAKEKATREAEEKAAEEIRAKERLEKRKLSYKVKSKLGLKVQYKSTGGRASNRAGALMLWFILFPSLHTADERRQVHSTQGGDAEPAGRPAASRHRRCRLGSTSSAHTVASSVHSSSSNPGAGGRCYIPAGLRPSRLPALVTRLASLIATVGAQLHGHVHGHAVCSCTTHEEPSVAM